MFRVAYCKLLLVIGLRLFCHWARTSQAEVWAWAVGHSLYRQVNEMLKTWCPA